MKTCRVVGSSPTAVRACIFNDCTDPAMPHSTKCDFHKYREKCCEDGCTNQAFAHHLCASHGGSKRIEDGNDGIDRVQIAHILDRTPLVTSSSYIRVAAVDLDSATLLDEYVLPPQYGGDDNWCRYEFE
ncbi:Aste57867_5121 [Aphanomyces stellatus]|uniref:Aste57867_5121 protein n=1 Tax=Aphanomyces stellatus TaxID=120398 RepID=A0A485KH55_9STRA|nr:hypothetical protein As57867_005108 [Aphanomyces stellatus]VFT82201.1 Aste57867_5121 [Aphanomyces stellatus]